MRVLFKTADGLEAYAEINMLDFPRGLPKYYMRAVRRPVNIDDKLVPIQERSRVYELCRRHVNWGSINESIELYYTELPKDK